MGTAIDCNNINKTADNPIKIKRILFPRNPRFLNFNENIGNSAIKSKEKIIIKTKRNTLFWIK